MRVRSLISELNIHRCVMVLYSAFNEVASGRYPAVSHSRMWPLDVLVCEEVVALLVFEGVVGVTILTDDVFIVLLAIEENEVFADS